MREVKKFAQRSSQNDKKRLCKYILLLEGEKTEPIYFDAINNKDRIGISPLIELVPIERTISEKGWSNPKKILVELISKLQETTTHITYKTYIDCIIDTINYDDTFKRNFSGFDKVVYFELKRFYPKSCLNQFIPNIEDEIDKILTHFEIWKSFTKLVESYIYQAIEKQQLNLEDDDKVCLIVDRDPKSFTQFTEVLKLCSDNNVKFYLSNPRFEFYLLLHNPNFDTFDQVKLATDEDNYLHKELKNMLGNYSKNSFNTEFLIEHINDAIANEKKFCESINQLNKKIGSNIALLIQEMRNF